MLCALLATIAVSTTAQAQYIQKWAYGAGTLADRPVTSWNGYYVLVPSENNLKWYVASTGAMLQTVAVPGINDAAFSSDSLYAVVAANTHVYKTRYDGGINTILVTDTKNVVKVATSKDGNSLAYVAYDSTAGTYELVGFNLTTSVEKFRVALAAKPSTLVFTPDSSKVVVDGPNVFDATTGAVVVAKTDDAGPLAVAVDGTYAVEYSAGTTGLLEARSLADGSIIWTKSTSEIASYSGGSLAISYNGNRVFVPGRNADGKASVFIYNSTTGAFVKQAVASARTDTTTGQVSLNTNPANFIVTLSQKVDNGGGDTYATTEDVNISDANAVSVRNDISQFSYPVSSLVASKGATTYVATGTTVGSSSPLGSLVVRNGSTGAVVRSWSGIKLGNSSRGALAISPDGAYVAAVVTGGGVTVGDVAGGATTSAPASGTTALSVAFSSATDFYTTASDGYLRHYTIGGGTVTMVGTKRYIGNPSTQIAINPAGTIALVLGPQARQIQRVDLAGTGLNTYGVASATGACTYVDFDLAGNGYVGYNNDTTGFYVRKYDVSTTTLNQIRAYGRIFSAGPDTTSYGLSPDGRFLVFSGSWINADGRRVTQTYLANGSDNSTATVWNDNQQGEGIVASALSADGSTVFLGRKDAGVTGLMVPAGPSSLTLSPDTTMNGSTGTVTMQFPVPVSVALFLKSSDPTIAAPAAAVIIPANATSATFPITTYGVDSPQTATISVYNGLATQTATLSVIPTGVKSITTPDPLYGASATGTVTIYGTAGPSGVAVDLTSDNAVASVPASVTIPAGTSSVTFPITLSDVTTDTPVTFTATARGMTATFSSTVKPNIPVSVTAITSPVCSGLTGTAYVTLAGPAKAGGEVVTLSSNSTNLIPPTTVTVAAGSKTGVFTYSTLVVSTPETDTVTATLNGTSATGNINLDYAGVQSVVLTRSSVVGGSTASATITLSGKAPVALTITLSTNNTAVATVPATVTIPANTLTYTFNITTYAVTQNTSVTIFASRLTSIKSAVLTVTPPR